MEPQIRMLSETKLIGKRSQMSFANNKIKELWQAFMPKRAGIKNYIGPNLYSGEIYNDTDFFKSFDPSKKSEKWAAVRVKDFSSLTNELEALKLPQDSMPCLLTKENPVKPGKRINTFLKIGFRALDIGPALKRRPFRRT
jgi:AraC family transcriptional regulator